MTPERHIFLAALIRKAAEIEVDLNLTSRDNPSALQMVLIKARRKAIESCERLIWEDATDTKTIVALQQDIRHFVDLVQASQAILEEAAQAEQEISDEERDTVSALVLDRHNATADDETDGEA